jgi:hypothetical protein
MRPVANPGCTRNAETHATHVRLMQNILGDDLERDRKIEQLKRQGLRLVRRGQQS